MQQQPITERANSLTAELDVAAPAEFLRLVSLSDAQLFDGWRSGAAAASADDEEEDDFAPLPATAAAVARAAAAIGRALRSGGDGARVVVGGAGTSGRVAWVCARDANAALSRCLPSSSSRVRYAIAGGDAALLTSQESAEDSPALAQADFARAAEGAASSSLVYVGVTCGLSAPYVLAQLQAALERGAAAAVLIGFSPLRLARRVPIEGWPGAASEAEASFFSVATQLVAQHGDRVHVITPVVGPEAVTGSTRLKGGSATKLLLDTMLSLAITHADGGAAPTEEAALAKLLSARPALAAVYESPKTTTPRIERALELCSDALRRGGSILYVGGGALGPFGVIDASECVPTFGASPKDVRAFVSGGWETLCNVEGDLSQLGGSYVLALETFLSQIAPETRPQDVVVAIGDGEEDAWNLVSSVRAALGQSKARVCAFAFCCGGDNKDGATPPIRSPEEEERLCDVWCRVQLPPFDEKDPLKRTCQHLATKLVLNALTTGSFTAAGKVFGNMMVDLRISNAKLYTRACNLVARLTGASADDAERSVIRAIHGERGAAEVEKLRSARASEHVSAAYQKPKVVPTALLLASGAAASVEEAHALIEKQPAIRTAIAAVLPKKH